MHICHACLIFFASIDYLLGKDLKVVPRVAWAESLSRGPQGCAFQGSVVLLAPTAASVPV